MAIQWQVEEINDYTALRSENFYIEAIGESGYCLYSSYDINMKLFSSIFAAFKYAEKYEKEQKNESLEIRVTKLEEKLYGYKI